jgi:hypothetical protein
MDSTERHAADSCRRVAMRVCACVRACRSSVATSGSSTLDRGLSSVGTTGTGTTI